MNFRIITWVVVLTAIAGTSFAFTRHSLLKRETEYNAKLLAAWASVSKIGAPGGRVSNQLLFDEMSGTNASLISGWNAPEPWGVWSRGKRAELAFILSNYPKFARSSYLKLTAKAFLIRSELTRQTVQIEHNGIKVADLSLDHPDGSYMAKLPLSIVNPDGYVKLTLILPQATPAERAGLPAYAGDLAIGLTYLSVGGYE